jgi:hypothetical protein
MDHQRPRWRFRLSTLVLLVIIAGLVSYIVADQWHRQREARRLEAEMQRALAEAECMRAAAAQQATAGMPAPTGLTE